MLPVLYVSVCGVPLAHPTETHKYSHNVPHRFKGYPSLSVFPYLKMTVGIGISATSMDPRSEEPYARSSPSYMGVNPVKSMANWTWVE
jgi:hypothetical protein